MKENRSVIHICFYFILPLIMLCSCTVITTDIDKNDTIKDNQLELSETHLRDVVHTLGPPAKLSRYNDGLVFIYESANIKENQIGLNFNYNILKLLKFSIAKGYADREILLLIFDKDGYLVTKEYREFTENLGSGQSISYLFSIEALVDSSKLQEAPNSLAWGASLLKPLPEALNYPQNLGTGDSGVEQLGAPNNVGQHTLELKD